MRRASLRCWTSVLGAVLLLAACTGADGIERTESPSPTPATTAASTAASEPIPVTLDEDTATQLYVAWRETVYALPEVQPDAVDIEAAGDGIVVPDSEASEWIVQELELARDRGVVVRGDIHAEPVSAVRADGDRATVSLCSSADVRITDVTTGDPVGNEAVDTSYTRFDVAYERIDDGWLIDKADPAEKERKCVPRSIEEPVTESWAAFTEAWYERDRQGGGDDLGRLTQVVTDEFADTLRGLSSRDPVPEPALYTNFELVAATRTTAEGRACRSGGMETIEWKLVDGQWRVDFAGQIGREPTRCP